jgi:hypothetical protein
MSNLYEKKECKYCRFYYLNMPEEDAGIIIERNPEWKIEFKRGQKLCFFIIHLFIIVMYICCC